MPSLRWQRLTPALRKTYSISKRTPKTQASFVLTERSRWSAARGQCVEMVVSEPEVSQTVDRSLGGDKLGLRDGLQILEVADRAMFERFCCARTDRLRLKLWVCLQWFGDGF